MAQVKSTAVIIPAFNEEQSLPGVIAEVKRVLPEADVIVVDDGSSDRTAQVAAQAGAKALSHLFNMGYGVSLQTGYKYVLEYGYEYLVQMDADGQHAPESIKLLLDPIAKQECDLALGSRFLGKGNYRPSLVRRIGIQVFRSSLWALTGLKITDPTTGFQAMNRRVVRLFASDVFPCDFPDADVIILVNRLKYRVREVAVEMHPNATGKSMHSGVLNAVYYVFKMHLSMILTLLRRYPESRQGDQHNAN